MCISCAIRDVGDAAPVRVTPAMERTAQAIKEWYEIDGHGAGGILHVVLDDHNVNDDCLDMSWFDADGPYGAKTKGHAFGGGIIIGLLQSMTLPERAVTVCLGHGEALPEGMIER